MKKCKSLDVNEICYLENENNYVSINASLNETALIIKIDGEYQTFIVMGNQKEALNKLNSDFEILKYFEKYVNGFWSNDVRALTMYLDNNFMR